MDLWIVPVLSSVKTSKLAAKNEEGTLKDKGPSDSGKGHSGQTLEPFLDTTAHFPSYKSNKLTHYLL